MDENDDKIKNKNKNSMLLLLLVLERFRCDHDKISQILVNSTPVFLPSTRRLKEETKKPIDIEYDFYFLDHPDQDQWACKTAGQVVTTSSGTHTCAQEDIITTEKLEIVKQTLNNVKKWYKETLNVTKHGQFNVHTDHENNGYPVKPNGNTGDSDLYLAVYQRPYGDDIILASALSFEFYSNDNTELRPQVGAININFKKLPSKAQDVDSLTRDFFQTCVHETIHALGFSEHLYGKWIDRRTKMPYGYPITQIESTKYPGKTFSLIQTPKLQELVKDKFGITKFDETPDAGVELEDGGGGGTAGTHFEARTYFTELMCGITFGIGIISQFSLGLLHDTGWYDVNFDKTEPFAYGDYRSVLGETKPYDKFAFGPPDASFPANYLSTEDQFACSFDNSYGGMFSTDTFKCSDSGGGGGFGFDFGGGSSPCCRYPSFTDSLNKGICDEEDNMLDYIPYNKPFTDMMCHDPGSFADKTNKYKKQFGKDSYCAVLNGRMGADLGCYKMSCSETNELTIYVGDTSHKCTKKGDQFLIPGVTDGTQVSCPDPKIICGNIKYIASFSNKTKPTPPTQSKKPVIPVKPTPEKKPTSNKKPVVPVKPTPEKKPIKPTSEKKSAIPNPTDQKVPVVLPTHELNDSPMNYIPENQDHKKVAGKTNTGAIAGGIVAAVVVIVVAAIVGIIGMKKEWWCKNVDSDAEAADRMTI